jgi:tRNA A58 N-methylase Trm61
MGTRRCGSRRRRATGGKVVTLEWAADKADFARQRVSEAGLADYVEFKIGDALESIAALVEPLDFVLIDLCTDRDVPPVLSGLTGTCARARCSPPTTSWRPSRRARARRTTSLP